MNQNPFFSTNTNFYDESFRSSAPTVLNGQHVILSQEQQRKVCDTLNTSVVGNNNYGINTPICPGNNIPLVLTQKQFFPGGATYTFSQSQPQLQPQLTFSQPQPQLQQQPQAQHYIQGICCQCSAPTTVALDASRFYPGGVNSICHHSPQKQVPMEIQPCGMDYLNYQQQLANNPFQLKFHNDHCTSCSDLLNFFTQIPGSNTNSNGLEINEKSSQITSECICVAKKCKNKAKNAKKPKEDKPKSKNKEKKQKEKKSDKRSPASSETGTSSGSESNSDCETSKKAKWWNKRKTHKSNSSSTSGTEETSSEDKERKRDKRQKYLRGVFNKDSSGQTTDD